MKQGMAAASRTPERPLQVWILGCGVDEALQERAGDARRTADQLGTGVAALVVGTTAHAAEQLIAYGVDVVYWLESPLGLCSTVATAAALLAEHQPRLVLSGGDCPGREWAAWLAVRLGYRLISPALMVQVRHGRLEVTGLHRSGRLARKIQLDHPAVAILTLQAGVAEAIAPDPTRQGELRPLRVVSRPEPVRSRTTLPADPARVDIRDAARLVAGGRGLGHKAGFEALWRFAHKIGAGVAASRMAVDLGWIERERQVGQTGKTVSPDLYIACGISGASHHLDGVLGTRHLVAINTDPEAPIFRLAHLGLVADLYEVLERAGEIIGEL
jgi:electron transfer flavoprotein alpha subunit